MNFTRLSVMLGCVGDTDGLAGWQWAWSKWTCTGAARLLTRHGRCGQRAATARKNTLVSTVGVLVI